MSHYLAKLQAIVIQVDIVEYRRGSGYPCSLHYDIYHDAIWRLKINVIVSIWL